jgi:hypothetical protein
VGKAVKRENAAEKADKPPLKKMAKLREKNQ